MRSARSYKHWQCNQNNKTLTETILAFHNKTAKLASWLNMQFISSQASYWNTFWQQLWKRT